MHGSYLHTYIDLQEEIGRSGAVSRPLLMTQGMDHIHPSQELQLQERWEAVPYKPHAMDVQTCWHGEGMKTWQDYLEEQRDDAEEKPRAVKASGTEGAGLPVRRSGPPHIQRARSSWTEEKPAAGRPGNQQSHSGCWPGFDLLKFTKDEFCTSFILRRDFTKTFQAGKVHWLHPSEQLQN